MRRNMFRWAAGLITAILVFGLAAGPWVVSADAAVYTAGERKRIEYINPVFHDLRLDRCFIGFDSTTGALTNIAAPLTITLTDTGTNAVVDVLTLDHVGGTIATGFGGGISFKLEDGTAASEEQASLDWVLTDKTSTSEDCDLVFSQNSDGSIQETLRLVAASEGDSADYLQYTSNTQELNAIENVLVLKLDNTDDANTLAAFGMALSFQLSDKGGVEEQASIDIVAVTTTNAAEDYDIVFSQNSSGAVDETLRLTADFTDETARLMRLTSETAQTDDVVDIMEFVLTGTTPVANFGAGIVWKLENDDHATGEEVAAIDVIETTVSTGAEDADIIVRAMLGGAVQPALSIDASAQEIVCGQNVSDGDGISALRIYPVTESRGSLLLSARAHASANYATTIQTATDSGAAVTLTLPNATATLSGIGLAETFGGVKTYSAGPVVQDDIHVAFGTGSDARIVWNTSDDNAECLAITLGAVAGNVVPVLTIGDSTSNADLGFFNGATQTTVAVIDNDNDSYLKLDFSDDDDPRIAAGGGATTLDIVANTSVTGTLTTDGALTCESIDCNTSATFGGGYADSGVTISTAGALSADALILGQTGFDSNGTPVNHFKGSGVSSGACIYFRSQTAQLFDGVTAITMTDADVNVAVFDASQAANVTKTMTTLYARAYGSTTAQANATLVGIRGEAALQLNQEAIRGIHGFANLAAEAKTIDNESQAVLGDVYVDGNTTVSAGGISALHGKCRSGGGALTGDIHCMVADAEMSVDTGLYMNVDTSMTATTGINLAGSGTYTTGLNFASTTTTVMNVQDVGTTSSHVVDMIDAYTGKVIETGTYASEHSKGVSLAAGNYRPVSLVFDDANAALGAQNYRALLSRVYLSNTQDQQIAVRSIQGQLAVADGADLDIGSTYMNAVNGVEGYIEFKGATTVGANTRVAAVHGLVQANADNITITSGGVVAGLYAECSIVNSKSITTDICAGLYIDKLDSDHTTAQVSWPYGIYINDGTTDIRLKNGTTLVNSTANLLTITEAVVAIAGRGTVSSSTADTLVVDLDFDGNTGVQDALVLRRTMLDGNAIDGIALGISFELEDDEGNEQEAASIDVEYDDSNATSSEDATIRFNAARAGTVTETLAVGSDGVIVSSHVTTADHVRVGVPTIIEFTPDANETISYVIPTGYDAIVTDAWYYKTTANGSDSETLDIKNNDGSAANIFAQVDVSDDVDKTRYDCGLIDDAAETLVESTHQIDVVTVKNGGSCDMKLYIMVIFKPT